MIKKQIIEQNGNPIAVILDYQEYLDLITIAQDKEDYFDAIKAEEETTKLTPLNVVKELINEHS